MKRCLFVCVALAMLFGVATAKADIATYGAVKGYGNDSQIIDYFAQVDPASSEWVFTDINNVTSGNPKKVTFNVTNGILTVPGEITQTGKGNSGFDLEKDFGPGTLAVSSQTAQNTMIGFNFAFEVSLPLESFIDAFYFVFSPHDNSNGLQITVAAYGYDDKVGESITLTAKSQEDTMFFGFIADEGDYFTKFVITVNDKNNGGYTSLILGTGDNGKDDIIDDFKIPPTLPTLTGGVTPEPATLLILGFGSIGAGFAARRRMSK